MSSFEARAAEKRKEEELRAKAYTLAVNEAAMNKKRSAALANRKKSKNLSRPKHAVIKNWGDWFDEMMVHYMPGAIYDTVDIASMPRWANIALITSFIFFSGGLMVYFTYAGMAGALDVKFISVQGNSTIQECQTVTTLVNGDFTADKYGIWNSDPTYLDNSAIYVTEFEATNVTQAEYETVMQGYGARLKALSQRMEDQDLAWIVAAWATVTYSDADTGIRFSTMASVETMFSNTMPIYVSSYSFAGECYPEDPVIPATDLQFPTAGYTGDFTKIKMTYDMAGYFDETGTFIPSGAFDSTASPTFYENFSPCTEQWDPVKTWNYDEYEWESSGYQETSLEIEMDLRSMLLAISVNFGIVSLDDLVVVRSDITSMLQYAYEGDMPPMQFYADPYADMHKRMMEPIACVPSGSSYPPGNTTEFPFCLVVIQNNFLYPSMWSKSSYSVTSAADYCDCSAYSGYSADRKEFCNAMYLEIIGVYETLDFYNKMDEYDWHDNVTWHVFELGAKYAGYMAADNITGDNNIRSELQRVVTDTTGDIDVFADLCPRNYTSCGAIMWTIAPIKDASPLTPLSLELGDLSSTVFTTSWGYAGYKQVACINTIYNVDAFTNMSSTPPTQLVESYYECSYTWNQAFITSIGNASASSALYTSFIMMIVIRIIQYLVEKWEGSEIENPRVKDFHDSKGDEKDKQIMHAALKRIIELGKADVLDPVFIELFKEDFDGDAELARRSIMATQSGRSVSEAVDAGSVAYSEDGDDDRHPQNV